MSAFRLAPLGYSQTPQLEHVLDALHLVQLALAQQQTAHLA
jgi:hypothetical protein